MNEYQYQDRQDKRHEDTRRLIVGSLLVAFLCTVGALVWARDHGQQSLETALAALFGGLASGFFGIYQQVQQRNQIRTPATTATVDSNGTATVATGAGAEANTDAVI